MLTDDMKRLSGEIHALRGQRGSMIGELQHEAKVRKHAIAELCAHLGSARTAMAKRTMHERAVFVHNLKRSVSAQLREMRHDLAGAQRAWGGKAHSHK